MQVEVYDDSAWPVVCCEPARGENWPLLGTVCDIPDELYSEWVAVNKRRRELAAKIKGISIRGTK